MIAGLEILNLHAQGGMAEVYRARGKGADGKVWFYAVKRILPAMANETLLEMFIEEARVASLLVHPNIVRVYDLTRAETGDYYIVMEFLEGHDVAEAIAESVERARPLPLWLAVHVAREVLQALAYANTQATDRDGKLLALVHRDISPPNIFLCSDGQVKLTDFGVAKVAQSQVMTQVGVTKGKFGYMSPEQITGEPLDGRSDLFNVGILLYEMITSRRLFLADTPSMFLQAMLKAEVPPIERSFGLPYELEALLRRSLARDREQRPESAAAFLAELSRIATRERLVVTRANVAESLKTLFPEHTQARAAVVAPSVTAEASVPEPPAPGRPQQRLREDEPAPQKPPRRFVEEEAVPQKPPRRFVEAEAVPQPPRRLVEDEPVPQKPPRRFVEPEPAPIRPAMRATAVEPERPLPRAAALEPERPASRAAMVEAERLPSRAVLVEPERPPPRVPTRSSHRAVPLGAPPPEPPSRPEPTVAVVAPSAFQPPRAPPVPLRPERPPTKKVQVVEPPSAATPRPSPVRPGTKQVRLLPEDEGAAAATPERAATPDRLPAPDRPPTASSSRATSAPPAEPPPDDPSTVPPEATAIQLGLRDAGGKATVKGSKRVVPIGGTPKK